MKQLWIIGAGGHGKVAADIAVKIGYDRIAFLDDNEEISTCGKYERVGKTDDFVRFEGDFFVAVGNAAVRRKLTERLLNAGKNITTLIHPSAVIAEDVTVGVGTVIMAGAVVNPGAVIGSGCIVNTCASVDHDCRLNDYVHVSVGAHLAGTVSVGERTWIGIGAVVSNNLAITSDCMIGAGAVVVKNITESGTYVGVPAEKMCPHENSDSGK